MSLDRDKLKAVFFEALRLAPGEVESYLDGVCGAEPELRREVESLLKHHDERELVTPGSSTKLTGVTSGATGGPQAPDGPRRYQELGELGVGGCGRVSSTWDRALRRRVARKEILLDRPSQRAMLLQEARLLAWLDHPGAVPVYDIDSGDTAAYTMRLLEGETLKARLQSEGKLSLEESIRILTRVSESMANAHAKGVLHLDLKPANLMLLPYGQVCVVDWGVARFHDLDAYGVYLRASGESELPPAGAYEGVAGTPGYMPNEQALGGALGPATDIYAVGTILYEMLVGRLPRPQAPHGDKSPVVPPRRYRPEIPERLEVLCLKMLAVDPNERPAGFSQVSAELNGLYGVDLGAERVLEEGEVLFREGDVGQEAFYILEGTLAVVVNAPSGPIEIARRSVGNIIGELAVVLDAPRSATITAVTATRVAVVSREVITNAMRGANPLLSEMLRSLSSRLRQETERLRR